MVVYKVKRELIIYEGGRLYCDPHIVVSVQHAWSYYFHSSTLFPLLWNPMLPTLIQI